MKTSIISAKQLEAKMQVWTLFSCLAVALLNCLILTLMLFALAGNRALRLELNSLATRLAVLEGVRQQQQQALELK